MSSVDRAEIARFSELASAWWNPTGALRPLHKMNPARLEFIRGQVCAHFDRVPNLRPLQNMAILDVGCGGGLLCEPMARMGAQVTGLDASDAAINVAVEHAKKDKLSIDYVCDSLENFARRGLKFDVVTALEILEHVADIASLMKSIASVLKPNGLVIFSTLNRTPQSFLLGVVAAEYLLQWVPRGTHDWRKFIKPSELAAHAEKAGLKTGVITGVVYDALHDGFHLKDEAVGINYLMTATF